MTYFKLAELYDRNGDLSKLWYVGYFFKHPETGKLQLFQIWISSKLKTKHSRRVKANELIEAINLRLQTGYNPFEQENPSFTNIIVALNRIIDYKKTYAKKRTIITARSFVKHFTLWLNKAGLNTININAFNYQYALKFADYLKIEKKVSNRTFNNYINGISSIFNNLIDREYIIINPFKRIKKLPETERTIYAYSENELNLLKTKLPEADKDLWTACQFIFYCAVRPAELVRMKIKDIDLNRQIISLPGEITKNRKNSIINIPAPFVEYLKKLEIFISPGHTDENFIFSTNLKPGTFQIYPTRLAERFRRFANSVGLNRNLYELKHTAIGLALINGSNINDIKYHCRHSDIKITEEYLKAFQSTTSKDFIKNYPLL